MHSFKDSLGRNWDISINVATIKRARDKTGVNLYALLEEGAKGLGELYSDPIRFTEVVYNLSKQSETLTDEDFCSGINGDTLEEATQAFQEELIFFTPKERRETLRRLFQKTKQVTTALESKLTTRAHRELEALDVDSLAEKLSGSSGSSPGNSGSVPIPTPSAS